MPNYTGDFTRTEGPKCRGCGATEARCAFVGGTCCAGCRHWRHLDTFGNDREGKPGRPPACDLCKYRRIPCSHRLENSPANRAENRLQPDSNEQRIPYKATETAS